MWLKVFFALFGLRSFFQLLKIFVIRNFFQYQHVYEIVRLFLIDGILIIWLLYGNSLYYSEQNDCRKNERTRFIVDFMGAILFVGYLLISLYLLLICTVPCLYLYVRHHMNIQMRLQQEAELRRLSQVPQILSSLSRVPFDEELFTHEDKCSICLGEYAENDLITQLRCDGRHYFHTTCIENWIKQG